MDLEKIFEGELTKVKWKMLGDYLKGRKLNAGSGTGITVSDSHSSGYTIGKIPERKIKPTQAPPFSVLSLRKIPNTTPSQYAATLQEGYVMLRLSDTDVDAVQEIPTIGGQAMTARPRPEITLTDGDFVACSYATTSDGIVDGTPVVSVSQSEIDSVCHVPASGAGSGSSGNEWIKLFQFNLVDGAPVITVFNQSDIEPQRLWKGRNVGGARYIHKERDGENDTYDFRTLNQVDVPALRNGAKIIQDFVNGDEFDDANDEIDFACLVEKLEDPQVEVNDLGSGVVEIKRNDKNGTLNWQNCEGSTSELLAWSDGLITTSAPGAGNTIVAGCGGDSLPSGSLGDMLYHNGTDWVVLPRPAQASSMESHVLFCQGGTDTVPEWGEVDFGPG